MPVYEVVRMPRLIDADALMEDIRKNSASYFADDFAHEWVDKQPTVDAVPIDWIKEWCLSQDLEYVRIAIKKMVYNWKAERKGE